MHATSSSSGPNTQFLKCILVGARGSVATVRLGAGTSSALDTQESHPAIRK